MEVIKTSHKSRAIFFVMHRNIISSKNQLQYYFYSKYARSPKPCLKSTPDSKATHGTLEQSCLTSSPITRAINSKPPKQTPMARVQRAASPLVVLLGKVGAWGRKTRFIEKNGFSFPKKRGDSNGDTSPLTRL